MKYFKELINKNKYGKYYVFLEYKNNISNIDFIHQNINKLIDLNVDSSPLGPIEIQEYYKDLKQYLFSDKCKNKLEIFQKLDDDVFDEQSLNSFFQDLNLIELQNLFDTNIGYKKNKLLIQYFIYFFLENNFEQIKNLKIDTNILNTIDNSFASFDIQNYFFYKPEQKKENFFINLYLLGEQNNFKYNNKELADQGKYLYNENNLINNLKNQNYNHIDLSNPELLTKIISNFDISINEFNINFLKTIINKEISLKFVSFVSVIENNSSSNNNISDLLKSNKIYLNSLFYLIDNNIIDIKDVLKKNSKHVHNYNCFMLFKRYYSKLDINNLNEITNDVLYKFVNSISKNNDWQLIVKEYVDFFNNNGYNLHIKYDNSFDKMKVFKDIVEGKNGDVFFHNLFYIADDKFKQTIFNLMNNKMIEKNDYFISLYEKNILSQQLDIKERIDLEKKSEQIKFKI